MEPWAAAEPIAYQLGAVDRQTAICSDTLNATGTRTASNSNATIFLPLESSAADVPALVITSRYAAMLSRRSSNRKTEHPYVSLPYWRWRCRFVLPHPSIDFFFALSRD